MNIVQVKIDRFLHRHSQFTPLFLPSSTPLVTPLDP